MAVAFEHSSTGNLLVDSLKGLQIVASGIDNPDRKIDYLRKGAGILAVQVLFDRQFMVMSNGPILANHPDTTPDTLNLLRHDLIFIGLLDSFSYVYVEAISLDSLVMDFSVPEVIGVTPKESDSFRQLTLRVPVLAIESCISAV